MAFRALAESWQVSSTWANPLARPNGNIFFVFLLFCFLMFVVFFFSWSVEIKNQTDRGSVELKRGSMMGHLSNSGSAVSREEVRGTLSSQLLTTAVLLGGMNPEDENATEVNNCGETLRGEKKEGAAVTRTAVRSGDKCGDDDERVSERKPKWRGQQRERASGGGEEKKKQRREGSRRVAHGKACPRDGKLDTRNDHCPANAGVRRLRALGLRYLVEERCGKEKASSI